MIDETERKGDLKTEYLVKGDSYMEQTGISVGNSAE